MYTEKLLFFIFKEEMDIFFCVQMIRYKFQ